MARDGGSSTLADQRMELTAWLFAHGATRDDASKCAMTLWRAPPPPRPPRAAAVHDGHQKEMPAVTQQRSTRVLCL